MIVAVSKQTPVPKDRPDLYPDGRKQCSKCGETKPVEDFRLVPKIAGRTNMLGIRDSHCKRCYSLAGMARKKLREQGVPPKVRIPKTYPDGVKRCSRCHETKTLEDFCLRSKVNGKPNITGLRHSFCRQCANEAHRDWYRRNPSRGKESKERWTRDNPASNRQAKMFHQYGLTLDGYDQMYLDQNGLCAICYRPEKRDSKRLSVDHDHASGTIRGLLCSACNWGLGQFEDNTDFLASAISYLNRSDLQ